MLIRQLSKILAITLTAFCCFIQASEPKEGSCTLIQKNVYAGPFELCQEPVSEDACKELGVTEENSNSLYSNDSCKQAGLVGSCVYANHQQHYYSGDPDGHEIGCGFMEGEWVSG